jgi:hypothetical protein
MNILFRFACPTNIACGLADALARRARKIDQSIYQFYLRDVEAV